MKIKNQRAPFTRSREELISFAQKHRDRPTVCETRLKVALRWALPNNIRIRTQHVLWGYIADLYLPAYQLDIEVDGGFHDNRTAYDRRRDQWLIEHGVSVMRFQNTDVEQRLERVLILIMRRIMRFGES